MLNLFELAKVIDESLEIIIKDNTFRIFFRDCEIKDYKSSSVTGSDWGIGKSIDEAADDYFRKINKKWLVFEGSHSNKRREYSDNIWQS